MNLYNSLEDLSKSPNKYSRKHQQIGKQSKRRNSGNSLSY